MKTDTTIDTGGVLPDTKIEAGQYYLHANSDTLYLLALLVTGSVQEPQYGLVFLGDGTLYSSDASDAFGGDYPQFELVRAVHITAS